MSVNESGLGSPEPSRRGKVLGILRDALRQKSMGVIEETAGEGHREVCEAGRRHRLADPRDEPVRDADRDRDLRPQVQGRRDLLAAPGEPAYDDETSGDAGGARGA